MPELTIISWRDIPAQVTAGKGAARGAAAQLSRRFQEAIDAAAMRAGLIGTERTSRKWRREARVCGDDLDAEVARGGCTTRTTSITDERLERLVRASGEEETA